MPVLTTRVASDPAFQYLYFDTLESAIGLTVMDLLKADQNSVKQMQAPFHIDM